jgi:outer membrane protein
MRKLLPMVVAFAVCGSVLAEDAVPVKKYTLDECLKIGLEKSATALNAQRDQAIARATVTQTRSQTLPQLSLSAGYTRLDELQTIDLGGESMQMGTLDNYKVDGKVTQLLFSGGKVGAALEAAKLSRGYADWARSDADAGLVRDIRNGFYDILLAKATIGVRDESVQQIQSLANQTESKFKVGAASEFDAISARVRLANEKPELIRAKNTYVIAVEGFKRLLNVDDAAFEIEGELVCIPFDTTLDELCKRALENKPAIKEMEVGVALKEQDVIAARSGYYPSLSGYFLYDGANSYSFVSYGGNLEWHWSAGAVLNWSLWDSGLTHGTVVQKKLELAKMRTNLDEFRKTVLLEVKQAYLDLERALETVEAGKGNVAMADKALQISKTRFDAGTATYLEFTDANLALRTAQLTLYSALRDHMNAVARLRYACGIGEKEFHGETNK